MEKWTRVVNVDTAYAEDFRTFPIGTDLLLSAGLSVNFAIRNRSGWAPIFCPRKFVADNQQLTTAEYELDEAELLTLGR